jgi:hypothetical protein
LRKNQYFAHKITAQNILPTILAMENFSGRPMAKFRIFVVGKFGQGSDGGFRIFFGIFWWDLGMVSLWVELSFGEQKVRG